MMSLERLHHAPVIARMFERYLDRCETVMREVFRSDGSSVVEMRGWLFESAPTIAAKMGIMHIEPFDVVAEYLGIDESHPAFEDFSTMYAKLADRTR